LNVIYVSSPVSKHFYAAGLHVAENRAGTIEYYHQDHLGSTRLKTNSTGGKVFSDNYKQHVVYYQQSVQNHKLMHRDPREASFHTR